MSQPLVSVITPSYNQAQYLEDSIESVFAQDYPSLEYLIADGGSTDGSIEIIRKYESQLAWWVSEADEGQAAAINKGMAQAQGEIVAWLNSDDLYLPGAIKEAVRAFQENPRVKMVFGNAITIDAQGVPLKELVFPDWELEDLIGFRIICQPAVFMRREVYRQVSGLDPRYHFMLDHHLWIRIASTGSILHRDSFWAAARHHEAAKNVSQAPAFGRETLEVLDWMQQQEDLSTIIKEHKRKVMAGAYRLNGRYLLDGGLYRAALKSYARAFINQPLYTARHWRRIIYACLGWLGVKNLDRLYSNFQAAQRPDLRSRSELRDWPGLCLDR
ncbi:MAG: glycosyltransferase family 2 protein [Anaerolineales bacterium]